MSNVSGEIKGLNFIYNETTDETTVTWSYTDDPDLDHFVLEVYDINKREWVPYDNHMGIVRKNYSFFFNESREQ